jgi:hypothetical protein
VPCLCKVTPVILHGDTNTTPCKMTGVTLYGAVSQDPAAEHALNETRACLRKQPILAAEILVYIEFRKEPTKIRACGSLQRGIARGAKIWAAEHILVGHSLDPALHQLRGYTSHPAPCTLHPPPSTVHPEPHTLHPTPFTLHPARVVLPRSKQ